MDIETVFRLAQEAKSQAQEAEKSVSSHEELCAERYDNIKTQLAVIPAINNAINDMRVRQAEQVALHKALLIVTLALGLIYTVMKIAGH